MSSFHYKHCINEKEEMKNRKITKINVMQHPVVVYLHHILEIWHCSAWHLCLHWRDRDLIDGTPTEWGISWIVTLKCCGQWLNVIQRDLDRLECWSEPTSWGSARPSIRSCIWFRAFLSTNTGNILREALRRKPSGCWFSRESTWARNVHWQPREPNISSAASKTAWPVGWKRWFSHSGLLLWHPVWSTVSNSVIHNKEERCGPAEAGQQEGHEDD